MKTLVRDYMTRKVSTIPLHTPAGDVAQYLLDSRISCLLVVDNGPVGIITDRDFTRMAANLEVGLPIPPLSELISRKLLSISINAETQEALGRMSGNRLRRLLVVDDSGEICGIITQSDLLRAHNQTVEHQKEVLEYKVAERTLELEKANAKLEQLTLVDPMLKIGNRRAMDLALSRILNHAVRYKRPYCVLLIDIDHFKSFNDFYGHQKGDEILIAVASLIDKAIRNTDYVYRYGGEEFLALLPETSQEGACIAGEHIRQAIDDQCITHEKSNFGKVTVSIGVCEERIENPNQNMTVKAADKALYRAKSNGRNRVEMSVAGDWESGEESQAA